MRRGEVWWAKLPPPIGHRPVLLLSRDEAYAIRTAVTVAELTTRVRHIPVEVTLSREDGLPKACVVNLDTLVTVRKELLEERICALSLEKLQAVEQALKFALALS